MRRILSKEDHAKKQRRNNLIIGGILIVVMLFSVLGYGFLNTEEYGSSSEVKYGEYEFIRQNSFWILELGLYQFGFRNGPGDTSAEIESSLKTIDNYEGKPLYISSDFSEASSEISINLGQIVQRIQFACLNETDCEEDFPIKDCTENFIIISEGNSSKIRQDRNCVFIETEFENSLQVVDEFLFNIIGVK